MNVITSRHDSPAAPTVPLYGDANADHGGPLSVSDFRGVLWRQRNVVGLIIGLVLALSVIVTVLTRPIFRATATARVELEALHIVEGQDLNPTISVMEASQYLNTLAAVVRSRSMAERVVDMIHLDRIPRFVAMLPRRDGVSDRAWHQQLRVAAVATALGGITVDVPIDSRVLSLNVTNDDPTLAALLANAYAKAFVTQSADRTNNANDYARQILSQQIVEVRAKLGDAENSAINYARQNRIVAGSINISPSSGAAGSSSGTAPTMTAATLGEVSRTYTEARAKRIAAQQRWEAASAMSVLSIPEVQASGSIQTLQTQRATVASQLADLERRYREGTPQVSQLQAQLATLDQQIIQAASKVRAGIQSEYQIAARQERALSGELDRVSDSTLAEQSRRVQYNLIDRDAQALRDQLSSLLQRYNQVSSAAAVRPDNILLLDEAQIPVTPISPNLYKNFGIALAIGIALAFAVAVLGEMFDDRLRSPDDVERKLGLRLLGMSPYVSGDTIDELSDPRSELTEAYASIQFSVDYALNVQGPRVIQITSSQPSEGKSTTSFALALQYGRQGERVLLIDADFRRPSLDRYFAPPLSETGLVDAMVHPDRLAEFVRSTDYVSLAYLPLGRIPSNPLLLLSSPQFAALVAEARKQFDVIILDGSPVMGLADAPIIARSVDAVVFVIEANRAHYGLAKTAVRRLLDAHVEALGAVLTKFKAREAGLNYGERYYEYAPRDAA